MRPCSICLGFYKEAQKQIAKERLQLVLIHDQSGVSPALLEKMKNEIIQVISKYAEINEKDFNIELTRIPGEKGGRVLPALVANIPLKNVKQK